MTTEQHDHINCYLDSKPHDQEWHNDRFYELSVHPDFCDEACPDYMETGKFCGTEEENNNA